MKVALFDFDGTLLRGNSWQLFFWWAVRTHRLRAPILLVALVLRRLGLIPARALRHRTLAVLRGKTGPELAELGQGLYRELLAPRLRAGAMRELAARRAEGCEIVLVSGAFDFLVAPFAAQHGIARWRATRLEYADGCFTGRIDGPGVTGAEKVTAVRALLADVTVDWPASHAYGDEAADAPVLALAGHPWLVAGPGPRPAGLPPGCRDVHWPD